MRRFNPDSVQGLVVHLDASDLSAGAITSWTDRKNGYVFTGTASRDAAINNKPTVTFNGSSDILSTAGNISQFGGVDACTFIVVAVDTNTASDRIVFEVGNGLQVGGQLLLSSLWPGSSPAVILANAGNAGFNNSYITETLASPGIVTAVNDFSQPGTSETTTIRWNGTTPTVGNIVTNNNTNQCAALRMHLGARVTPSLFWPGSIAKLLAYNRRLSTDEMAFIERGVAKQLDIKI
jgi:hypothetical protein